MAADQGQRRPFAGQPFGNCPANASIAGAGDQHDLSGEAR
jgi:hypothetical protein